MGGVAGRAVVFSCPIPVKWPLQEGHFGLWEVKPFAQGQGTWNMVARIPAQARVAPSAPHLERRNRLLEFDVKEVAELLFLALARNKGPGMAMACPCLADVGLSQRSGLWASF